MKIQFILKKNECYSFVSYTRRSSGLWNSTRFIVESLNSRGIEAEIVEVNDNNDIDREVRRYRPDLVVIEALWVVPEKFEVLEKLHPNVKWFVHMHSGIPFLALEGIAMDWLIRYNRNGIGIIANSPESYDAFNAITEYPDEEITYLPNVYISSPRKPKTWRDPEVLDIGCFGAVRPMKNQLTQALAAIEFAKQLKRPMRFHVNASRIETGGQPVLKNLRQLFDHFECFMLVESKWNEPEEFLDYLADEIDIGLQVSLTETFNVVTADYVTAGIPVVISKEIKWASKDCIAQDDSVKSIVDLMHRVHNKPRLIKKNQTLLLEFSKKAQDMWADFVIRETDPANM